MFRRSPSYPLQAVAAAEELAVGGVKVFTYPTAQDPCILLRPARYSYVAYSQKCTHISCAVYYAKEQNRLECPCHQGLFSVADGTVLQGRPQRALPRVALEMRDGQLVAVGMEGRTAIDGAMVLIVVLLIVQIWLLSATLENYLAGHREAAVPGAIVSSILSVACLGLYLFVDRIDSEVRKG